MGEITIRQPRPRLEGDLSVAGYAELLRLPSATGVGRSEVDASFAVPFAQKTLSIALDMHVLGEQNRA